MLNEFTENPKSKPLIQLLLILFFYIIGSSLFTIPLSPDEHHSPTHLIGAFLIFSFYLLSLLSLGSYINKECIKPHHPNLGLSIALGSAFGTLIIQVLGFSGMIGHKHSSLLILILLFIPILKVFKSKKIQKKEITKIKTSKMKTLVFCIILLPFVISILKGFLPHGHSDPLNYNLPPAKYWVDKGHIFLDPERTIMAFSSSVEYLHVWGMSLLTDSKGNGLIAGQIFSQMNHLVFGYIGTFFSLSWLLQILGFSRSNAYLSTAVALTASPTNWMAHLAKNDWIIINWVITGGALLFEYFSSRKNKMILFAAGVLWGLSSIGKLTSVLNFLPFIIYFVIENFSDKKFWKDIFYFLVVCLISASGTLIRNFYYQANPFYPFLNSLFSSSRLPNYWINELKPFQSTEFSERLNMFLYRVKKIPSINPINTLGIALLFNLKINYKKIDKVIIFYILCVLSFLLSSWILGKGYSENIFFKGHLRYLGGIIFLLGSLPTAYFYSKIRNSNWKFKSECIAFLTIFLIAYSYYRSPYLLKSGFGPFSKIPPNAAVHILHHTGKANSWIRLNLDPNEKILSTGVLEFYYLSHFNIRSIHDSYSIESELKNINNSQDFLSFMNGNQFRYILDSLHYNGKSWSHYSKFIDDLIKSDQVKIVFSEQGSRIIKLLND